MRAKSSVNVVTDSKTFNERVMSLSAREHWGSGNALDIHSVLECHRQCLLLA